MKKRSWSQLLFFFALNPHLLNFVRGTVHSGATKSFCVPVLNCYSCPAAAFSCPIGALQTVAGAANKVSHFVLGTLVFIGSAVGRAACGWVCPFGWLQDALARLKGSHIYIPRTYEKMRYFWLGFTLFAGMWLTDPQTGVSIPPFCKYICPQGTLQAGVPLTLSNYSLRSLIGPLFWFKVAVLMLILGASVLIKRGFCRFMCPLGAIMGLTNYFSWYQITVDNTKCVKCESCVDICPVEIDIRNNPKDFQCVRCSDCAGICPTGAIGNNLPWKKHS